MLQRWRDSFPCGPPPLQRSGDFCRYNVRPSLGGVETDDAHGMAILAVQEDVDQCLAVVLIGVLPPGAPHPNPGGVQHDVGVVVRILRLDRWRARHTEKLPLRRRREPLPRFNLPVQRGALGNLGVAAKLHLHIACGTYDPAIPGKPATSVAGSVENADAACAY